MSRRSVAGRPVDAVVVEHIDLLAVGGDLGRARRAIAWSLHELAIAGRRQRRPPREQASMLLDALLVHHQLGDRWRVASVLEEVAGSLLARQDPRKAVEMLACTETLRLGLGTPVPPAESPDREAALSRLDSKLSPAAVASAWSDGRGWELDQAVDEALRALELDSPQAETPTGDRH